MVNRNNNEATTQDEVEITTENDILPDPEITEIEENQQNIISSLKKKLKDLEAEKRLLQEDLQRTKADFLNARKRLDEERLRDRERLTFKHMEQLIPLCDSFELAMANKEIWEKADANWRKGIEGIYAQLNSIMTQYGVKKINPVGEKFDPYQHEALSTIPVTDKELHDKIVTIIQPGYAIKNSNDQPESIRPARVVIGVFEQN